MQAIDQQLSLFFSYLYSPLTWIFFIIGLLLGSFYNVCIYRIPRAIFWKSHRSFCPDCEKMIPFWDNLPLLSFVLLKGSSRCCSKPISIIYPIVELISAIMFAGLYWNFPFILNYGTSHALDSSELLKFIHAIILFSFLLVCAFIDIKHRIIPDKLSWPMIGLTPVAILINPELSWKAGLIGAIVGLGSVYVIAWLYYLIRRRDGIGMGDAKLLAAIGGWLGYQAIIPVFFYGSILGSIFGLTAMLYSKNFSLKVEIPFGPFLAIGAMIHMLSNAQIYRSLIF